MKKKLVILSVVGALLLAPTFAFADSSSNVVDLEGKATYHVDKALNVEEVIDRAKKGISDLDIGSTVTESTYNIDGKEFDVKTYRTAKLVGREVNQSLRISNVNESNEVNIYAISAAAVYDSSRSESKSDDSISVTTYSTFYMAKSTDENGVLYGSLVSANGGWRINDYTTPVSITAKKFRLGQNGMMRNGPTDSQSQGFALGAGPGTFDHTLKYGWNPVALGQRGLFKSMIGVITEAEIVVHGSSSKLVLINTYE